MNIGELMKENAEALFPTLVENLKTPDPALELLYSSMRYSATSGGKRIRPYLVSRFCRLFGGDEKAATPFECAIEYVHASSLIHDDMPCMDNDDLRRGKPTNHVVFGEDIALLAGDALMTRGFETAATNPYVSADAALFATKLILKNSGGEGMMGGQQIDLVSEKEKPTYELLLQMHAQKTGALIRTAALLGCVAAGITDENDARFKAADKYAAGIGLAFQIIDDILDVEGDAAILGKAVHADEKEGKTTFMSFMSPAEAREYAKKLTDEAVEAIRQYPSSEELVEFAYFLLKRNK